MTLLYFSLSWTEWAKGYISRYEATLLWGFLHELLIESCHSLRLRVISIASNRSVTLWQTTNLILSEKSLKSAGDAFFDLVCEHFHLANSNVWVLTSKGHHLTIWNKDLWSGHWCLLFNVCWLYDLPSEEWKFLSHCT